MPLIERVLRLALAMFLGTAGVLVPLAVVLGAWPFLVYNNWYRQCVHLENGLNLGYEAVFDLGRSYFQPIAVPKFDDGTPVFRTDMWEIFVTDTTLYGLTFEAPSGKDYRLAWRADTGLVLQDDDVKLYETLVAEAGDTNRGIQTGSIGTGAMLNILLERQEHSNENCPTGLITW